MTTPRQGPDTDPGSQTIIELDDPASWNACVNRSEGASFCHLWEWREVIEDTTGQRCFGGHATVGMVTVSCRSCAFEAGCL